MAQPTNTTPHSPAWRALQQLGEQYRDISIRQLFSHDKERAEHWRHQSAGLEIDLSRNHIDNKILDALLDLAEEQQLQQKISRLLSGEIVNHSEGKPAQHSAWRQPINADTPAEITTCRRKIQQLSTALRDGSWRGADDQRITDVVNIGIGGSDIGPRMVCTALEADDKSPIKMHFVANIDPLDLEQTLRPLQPKNTLVIISSKSFNTAESLQNAHSARRWLQREITEDSLSQHIIAITAKREKALAFGVENAHILSLAEDVGGRFSIWAATGLPIAIAVGYEKFEQLLAGARAMDQHFAETAAAENLPCLLALLDVWHTQINQSNSSVVLPYSHKLRKFPAHIQQLSMESNGKSVDITGRAVQQRSGGVVWGAEGSPSQHSFHQLLHQGTESVPVDFILPLSGHCDEPEKQAQLVAHCLAQSKALLDGRDSQTTEQTLLNQGMNPQRASELAPHAAIPGNRPNTLIAMPLLEPHSLGALIALYEHKVFAISALLNINAFDQWGVELGKQLSAPIHALLRGTSEPTGENEMDAGTAWWIQRYRQSRKH